MRRYLSASIPSAHDLARVFLIILVALFILGACAKSRPQTPKKRIPGESSIPQEPPEEAPPPPSVDDAPSVPKRQASQQIVEKGVVALKGGDLSSASQRFQEAINVDGTNGVAYYYLAEVSLKKGDPDRAAGFLEKAESLLQGDQAWEAKIEALYLKLDEAYEGNDAAGGESGY